MKSIVTQYRDISAISGSPAEETHHLIWGRSGALRTLADKDGLTIPLTTREHIVLAVLAVGTILFIRQTFKVFEIVGAEPSALVGGFFALVTSEAAMCWRIHESRKKREGRDKEAPDKADLDIEADPNEPEDYEEDEKSSGGEG